MENDEMPGSSSYGLSSLKLFHYFNALTMEVGWIIPTQIIRKFKMIFHACNVPNDEKDELLIEILVNQALKTSDIEGEYLDRDSVQESSKKNLGLDSTKKKLPPAEFGISEMMVDLYRTYDIPLNYVRLSQWHGSLTISRRSGRYWQISQP